MLSTMAVIVYMYENVAFNTALHMLGYIQKQIVFNKKKNTNSLQRV